MKTEFRTGCVLFVLSVFSAACRILLPTGAGRIVSVSTDGREIPFHETVVESSMYAEFSVKLPGPALVRLVMDGQ